MNLLEIVGESMGLHHDDHFKRLKMMQDADAIMADCRDLIAEHGLDAAATRAAIQAMLDEQPLPLRGSRLVAVSWRRLGAPLPRGSEHYSAEKKPGVAGSAVAPRVLRCTSGHGRLRDSRTAPPRHRQRDAFLFGELLVRVVVVMRMRRRGQRHAGVGDRLVVR